MLADISPTANSGPRTIEITVHRCINISPDAGFRFIEKKREYYVEVTVASERKQTKNRRRQNQQLEWNEKFIFDNVQVSSVTLSLYYRRTWHDPNLVQQLTCPITVLDGNVKSLTVLQTECFPDGSHIEFSIKRHGVIEQAKQALGSLARHTPKDGWKRFLEGIESFRDLVENIAEVHPYAKLAHTLLFAIPGPLIEQLELDEDVQTLFDSFARFCDIVSELQDSELHESKKLGDVLKRIILQMTEVAYFVRDYCKEENFLKKALKNKFIGVSDAIQEYYAKIGDLKDEFHTRLGLQAGMSVARTEVKVMRVIKELETIGQSIDLNDIPYVPGAGLNLDKRCLGGTREKFLEEIENWINSDGSRTLLISGGAGTGKSSIAQTIAARFRELGRRGSVFCFSEGEGSTRKPTSLFSHIARDLADLDLHIRIALAKAVQDRADRTTSSITAQFEELILAPANAIRDYLRGPIVVVIDGLDESGPVAERGVLLKVLADRLKELPPNFRFIITSRPDPDIENTFKLGSDIIIKRMQDIPHAHTSADIVTYVRSQFANQQYPDIGRDKCDILASHANGLFQWARVACQFIQAERAGETALDRYEELIQPLPGGTGDELAGDSLLDYLYRIVLSKVLSPKNKAMEKFKFVMARVLTAFEPLSSRSLNEFVVASKVAPKNCKVESVVKYLGSLLSGVDDEDAPIRPLHTSFRNFLANSARSKEFFVDLSTPDVHSDMALASMRIMEGELTFNICHLETSYLSNKKIPGIENLIKKYIPRHLSYACRFWAAHLLSLQITDSSQSSVHPLAANHWSKIMGEVDQLFSNRLLYYLEVLSLECAVDPGIQQIRAMRTWFKEVMMDKNVILLVEDVEHFFSYFAKCIATSVPHIYISALPFAPKSSLVTEHYAQHRNRTLALISGQLKDYPSWPHVLHGHSGVVNSVRFSPDGARIVSGSDDGTIRVWEGESGETVIGPIQGHTNWVRSVGFSPDGTRIVSGSRDNTIRLWNAKNGEMVIGPLLGHTNWISSVRFSPDGSRIVSGSNDETIRVWDVESGEMVLGPLKGHTNCVRSVRFSPDGTRIVSGSDDDTIRIWDAENGKMILGPLKGHTYSVNSVGFSPDGTRIVSGSGDNTIRVWDAENGDMVIGPLDGHTDWVYSVEFSPDGTHIVSGSKDNTIRVWNVENGELVTGPLHSHTDWVKSVGFSPDGTHIVSGSSDYTIRMWNTENDNIVTGPLPGHTGPVGSVGFSPDGTRIVSGSDDSTIRIWDVESGEMILGPLQGHTHWVTSVGFSPNGTRIVSGSKDNTIRVWNVKDGEMDIGPLHGHTDWVNSVRFSPDGSHIVSGSGDKTIRVWNAESGEMVLGPLQGHTDSVNSVGFSPDGTRIVSGSDDDTIRVWDAENGAIVIDPIQGTDWISSVGFSPDGNRIVSGSRDNAIQVWNAENGELVIGPLYGHTDWVYSVEFSPDGSRIVSGSDDKTIRVWDAKNGEMVIGPVYSHTSAVYSVGFSPDGTCLVSGSADTTCRVQRIPGPQELLADPLKGASSFNKGNSTENDVHFAVSPNDTHRTQQTLPQLLWRMEDGWSLGANDELLFHVPPAHRANLYHPITIGIMSTDVSTRLDMSNFAHGACWTECFNNDSMNMNHD